jgi:hypothetical protein
MGMMWLVMWGLMWLGIGIGLTYQGLSLLAGVTSGAIWVGAGLFVGFIKGRFVLSKTVIRTSRRIVNLPKPVSFKQAVPPIYGVLVLVMMGFGFLLKFVPQEVRGMVNVVVGSALMHGAMLFFRITYDIRSLSEFQARDRAAPTGEGE